jgi:O-antigen/teichoic acid export membrane protein
MRQSHRLIYNAMVGWVAHVVEVAIGFLLLPFLVHRVGAAGYGIYGLAFSVSMALDFVRVALAAALTKFVAGYAAQDSRDDINRVLGTTCAFGWTIGLLAGGAVIALQNPLADLMSIAPADREVFQDSLVAMGVLIAVSFGLMPYLGVLLGYQRHDLMRLGQAAVRIAQALLMVGWFVFVGPAVTPLAVITLICGVLLHLVWMGAAYRSWPWLRGSPRQFRVDTLKMVLGFAVMMILIGLTAMLMQQGGRWIVGGMISVDFVTYFTVMTTPAWFIFSAVQDLTLTIMPAASKYQAADNQLMLIDLFVRGTRYSLLIAGACVAIFAPILHPLLNLWMGPEFEHLASPMLPLLVSAGLGGSCSCAHNMLKGLGKPQLVLASSLTSAIISLILMAVAIKVFKATDWAVSLGFATFCVLSCVLQNWLCLRVTEASWRKLLWQAYGQPLVILVPVVGGALLLTRKLDVQGVVPTAISAATTVLAFALPFSALFFSAEEWQLARETLQAGLRKLGLSRPAERTGGQEPPSM